jgi:hypothetical protein
MKGVNMKSSKAIVFGAGFLALVLTFTGCSSATPTDTPGVDRLGEYILRQEGPELVTVVGYRFASSTLGDEWLILEVGLTSPNGQTARVTRKDIFVRNPAGNNIPVATQTEFTQAYGSLRSTLAKANVDRDPLDYFPPSRIECPIQFFVAPGEGVSFDEVTLNDRRGCYGRLFFKVPGGIQAGRWVLGVDLPESEIRIPFEL